MAWLDDGISFARSKLFEEAIIAACNFGSIHQKEFKFFLHGLDTAALACPCTRDHPQIRIEGRFAKDSAIYPPDLGMHLLLDSRKLWFVWLFENQMLSDLRLW